MDILCNLKQVGPNKGVGSKASTLDYLIAVGYQINIAMGIFPEIDKRSLLNNCSLEKNFKKIINIALSTSKNMLMRHVVYFP